MDDISADYWANTMNAQNYSGLSGLNMGQYFLSLLLVVLVILILAWLAKKAGWMKKQTIVEDKEDQVIFYACFGEDQQIMLVNQEKEICCYITQHDKTQLVIPMPNLIVSENPKKNKTIDEKPVKKKGRTFQDIWVDVLKNKKGKH